MKNKIIDRTLAKFILVGIINTLFGTTIMFAAYNLLHLSYWVSSGMNYFFGSILSYFLNKYFTFQSKEKSLAEIVRFIVNILVCYFLAYGIAKPLTGYLLQNFAVISKLSDLFPSKYPRKCRHAGGYVLICCFKLSGTEVFYL